MTPLRPRRLEDLHLRGRSARTQELSGRAVRPLADQDPTSPDRLTQAARRASCLFRKHLKPDSRAARPIAVSSVHGTSKARDSPTGLCNPGLCGGSAPHESLIRPAQLR